MKFGHYEVLGHDKETMSIWEMNLISIHLEFAVPEFDSPLGLSELII